MVNPEVLRLVAADQKRWSLTGNELKTSIASARWSVFVLAVSGAIFATWGAQIHVHHPSRAQVFGYLGAASLALVAVIRQWKLGPTRIQSWIFARSASEALNREIYPYRTATGPYSGTSPEDTLLNRREEILANVRSVQDERVELKVEVDVPGQLDANGYLQERIDGPNGQLQFYTSRAQQSSNMQGRLQGIEFFLALLGALLGAALTITGKQAYGAWVAVITTISGSLAATYRTTL